MSVKILQRYAVPRFIMTIAVLYLVVLQLFPCCQRAAVGFCFRLRHILFFDANAHGQCGRMFRLVANLIVIQILTGIERDAPDFGDLRPIDVERLVCQFKHHADRPTSE